MYVVGGDVHPRFRGRLLAAAGAFHTLGGLVPHRTAVFAGTLLSVLFLCAVHFAKQMYGRGGNFRGPTGLLTKVKGNLESHPPD